MPPRGRANYLELAKWAKASRLDGTTTVELVVQSIGDDQPPICEWDHTAIYSDMPKEDREAWAQEVIEFAQSDCDARGNVTSRYYVRRLREDGGRPLAFPLLMRRSKGVKGDDDDDDGDERAPAFDGSAQSIISQQQRMIEKTHNQVIAMSASVLEHQRGSLALLDQAYRMIGKLMNKTETQHEKLTERDESVVQAAIAASTPSRSSKASDSDDPFDGLVPLVKEKIAEKIAGQLEATIARAFLGSGDDGAPGAGTPPTT